MSIKIYLLYPLFCILFFVTPSQNSLAQSITIQNNSTEKTVILGNEKMKVILDYHNKATISFLAINGQKLIESSAGIFSEINTKTAVYSPLHLLEEPSVKI